MNHNRRLAGKIAQSRGANFEILIQNYALMQGWKVLRIPDGCRQLGKGRIMRVKSPFDYIAAKNFGDKAAHVYFDAKTTADGTFSRIDLHQLEHLGAFAGIHGVMAGYIINFTKHDKIAFFPVSHLRQSVTTHRGLRADEGLIIGHNQNIWFDAIYESREFVALGTR